ncbi:MAG: exbB 1 [Verrucomicrobiaceae bacterium]|nr:exbB 1 [Verrucomicrobiaceae bacterium]
MRHANRCFSSGMILPSPPLLLANGIAYGFDHCTLPGKVLCALLVVLSFCSWTVMGMKLFLLRRSRLANREFEHVYRSSPHPLGVFQSGEHFDLSPFYHIYYSAARELAFQLVGIDHPDRTFATRLQGAGRITSSQAASVHRAMERSVAEAALKFEANMGVVAIALSGAPFIGLLGTVWGVMDSFAALAQTSGATSLQVMAPGICAALLTTVAGLLVAVPSMFGYNLLVSRIRAMLAHLDNYASELASILDRHYVDHRSLVDELPSLGALGSPNLPAFAGGATSPSSRAPGAATVSQPPAVSPP